MKLKRIVEDFRVEEQISLAQARGRLGCIA